MIVKKVKYRAICDICGGFMDFESTRASNVASGLRKCKWKVDGKFHTCPDCQRKFIKSEIGTEAKDEIGQILGLGSGTDPAPEDAKDITKFCKKCGTRLAEVWENGNKVGLFCAGCNEEKRF